MFRVIETRLEVWENKKCYGNTSWLANISTAFSGSFKLTPSSTAHASSVFLSSFSRIVYVWITYMVSLWVAFNMPHNNNFLHDILKFQNPKLKSHKSSCLHQAKENLNWYLITTFQLNSVLDMETSTILAVPDTQFWSCLWQKIHLSNDF